jgi:methylenetetrahydrofolate reductase (NADPH)
MDVLKTGLLPKHGIKGVDLAGYPEGNARLAPLDPDKLLAEKMAVARAQGLDVAIATQFGFEAAPILSWLGALRDRGERAPVRLGMAGPANIVTLLKYGVRCGIGGSLKALQAQPDSLNRQLGQGDPVKLLKALEAGWPASLSRDDIRLHVYAFGGVRRTAAWLAELRDAQGAAA